MVKSLRICAKCLKLFILTLLIILIWGTIWLREGMHSLQFAKPWILHSVNAEDAPYRIDFDTVSLDWRSFAELGKLNISHITFSTPGGDVFARLPEVYTSIDPIGFLPHHHTLNRVTLRAPHVFLTRSVEGTLQGGLEGGDSQVPLADLFSSFGGNLSVGPEKPLALPFRDFVIEHGAVNFHDEKSNTELTSQDFNFKLARYSGHYSGSLNLPFIYGEEAGHVTGTLISDRGDANYHFDINVTQFPATLICNFAPCPEKTEMGGMVTASARVGITGDGGLLTTWVHITMQDFTLTAPQWFEKKVVLGQSDITSSYDFVTKTAAISELKLSLEDTNASVKATAQHKSDGWYIEATSVAGPLDITKLHKYWPLTMARDTRLWVTSKLKAGKAVKGIGRFHITPQDIAAGQLSDASLDADVQMQGVSVSYLAGFPEMKNVDGEVHFTGATVRVNAHSGTMLSGTTISKATLWCPNLLNPKNPMETTIVSDMPAADVAVLLSMPLFTFDDAWGLNATKATGTVTSTMQLKFDAFSGRADAASDTIYLDGVDYNIKAEIKDFAQPNVFSGYDVKGLNGTLAADNKSTQFTGTVNVADTGVSNFTLTRRDGKPLVVTVKNVDPAPGKPANDFTLSYLSNTVPEVTVEGSRLDASASYGGSKNNLLKDFPALRLNVNLDELVMAQGASFKAVKGVLFCTAQRCESMHFKAGLGRGLVNASITKPDGQRQLLITTSDAGNFLKELDITDRMTGGKLELRGTYDDTKPQPPFNGKLAIHDFNIKNSPILGRIFSVGSLSGLRNALTGSGISFDKLLMDINARAGVITVSNGRANGTATGITVSGTVDTSTTKLNLKGVVVPAYALNSMLSNIPIIGALAGGEGEGLIAFNYSIRGSYAEPEVRVNPLSGLTPGFLRGIFRIFDRPADKPATNRDEPLSAPITNFNQSAAPAANEDAPRISEKRP